MPAVDSLIPSCFRQGDFPSRILSVTRKAPFLLALTWLLLTVFRLEMTCSHNFLSRTLLVVYHNAQSCRKKTSELNDLVTDHDIYFVLLYWNVAERAEWWSAESWDDTSWSHFSKYVSGFFDSTLPPYLINPFKRQISECVCVCIHPLVEFVYLVFSYMPGESYRRRLWSLLCLCCVFRALINSLVCGFRTNALGLIPFQTCCSHPTLQFSRTFQSFS